MVVVSWSVRNFRSARLIVERGAIRVQILVFSGIFYSAGLELAERGEMGEAALGLQTTRSLRAVIKEKDDELALFLEMRKREREGDGSLLVDSPEDFDPPPGSNPGGLPIFKLVPSAPTGKEASDDFLNAESEKNEYDWLLTPPGTPLLPYLEQESNPTGHIIAPVARATSLKSRLTNPPDALQKGNLPTKQMPFSGPNTSTVGTRRPLSSGGLASVLNKPSAGQRTVSSKSSGCPGSMPSWSVSRPAAPTSRPTVPVTSKSSRSSTPTARTTLPAKPTGPPRSTTPSRSSTPTYRQSMAPIKPLSRGSTPPRRSSVPANPANSGAPGQLLVTKTNPVVSNSSGPARASSPAVKSLIAKPSGPHNFSNSSTTNPISTAVPGRPISTSRGSRQGPASSRSLSAEPALGNKIRRQSCSPSRGRAANSITQNGISVPSIVRLNVNVNDDVNPVLIGTKMVERVINARRVPPPKQDSMGSFYGNASLKTASNSSGFGRTLSKKSLDMALRHMDIRQCPK